MRDSIVEYLKRGEVDGPLNDFKKAALSSVQESMSYPFTSSIPHAVSFEITFPLERGGPKGLAKDMIVSTTCMVFWESIFTWP